MRPVHSLPLVLAAVMAACVPRQTIVENNPFQLGPDERPWVIAHRGGRALWPENTIIAFDGALHMEVDAFELDVNLTRDEQLVVLHDSTIDRTSDGSGRVLDYSYEELQAFNFGYHFKDLEGHYSYREQMVPLSTLEDLFIRYPDIPMIIEIKNEGKAGKKAVEIAMELLERHQKTDHCLLASFHDEVLDFCRAQKGHLIFTSTASGESRRFVLRTKTGLGLFYKPRGLAAQLPLSSGKVQLAKKRLVRAAHRRKMAIHYWTVNDPADMQNLIALEVDGIITDRPDLMMEILNEKAYK